MDCIFCKIINGDIPSYTIYEDDIVKVFLDVNPVSNGHMLIIPKKHTLDLESIELDELTYIMGIAKNLKGLIEEKLHNDGLIVTQNNGIEQAVKHYHLHLIPTYENKQKIKDVKEIYEIFTK